MLLVKYLEFTTVDDYLSLLNKEDRPVSGVFRPASPHRTPAYLGLAHVGRFAFFRNSLCFSFFFYMLSFSFLSFYFFFLFKICIFSNLKIVQISNFIQI
jgi:hypothetical protein